MSEAVMSPLIEVEFRAADHASGRNKVCHQTVMSGIA
jgi:hypothetical protein